LSVVLPFVFGNLNGAILASDLDANFNALAAAINESSSYTAGQGININSGGTISFAANGVPLDGATVNSHAIGSAFLSLFNTGTVAQTVQGPVNFTGTFTASGSLFLSGGINYQSFWNWSGGPNVIGGNLQPGGVFAKFQPGGTIVGGTTLDSSDLNCLLIEDNLNVGITSGVNAVSIYHNINGNLGATGGRQTFQAVMTSSTPFPTPVTETSNTCGAFYIFVNGNQGGTSGFNNGAFFGLNPKVVASGNATYLTDVVGGEVDMAVYSGSSTDRFIGWHVGLLPGHAVRGSLVDCGVLVAANSADVGFLVAYSIGSPYDDWPLNSDSTIIKAVVGLTPGGTIQALNGIDFSAVSFTAGGYSLKMPSFTVDPSGNTVTKSVAWGTASIVAAGSNQATATAITAQDCVVTSGSGGVRLVNFNNGAEVIIRNRVGASITIYPQASAQIETAGTNVGLTLPNGTDGRFQPFSTTQWYY